jgi:hypothetical protein
MSPDDQAMLGYRRRVRTIAFAEGVLRGTWGTRPDGTWRDEWIRT